MKWKIYQYCITNWELDIVEKYLKSGTCIFLHETLEYETINLKKLSSDLDVEVCAIITQSIYSKICILSIYTAPSGNFSHFIKKLNDI
jgi:hypothetical protein